MLSAVIVEDSAVPSPSRRRVALDDICVLLSTLRISQSPLCPKRLLVSCCLYSATSMTHPIPPIAVLPTPSEDDSVSILNVKLSSYLYVLHVGNSIAAATGAIHDELKHESPERRA